MRILVCCEFSGVVRRAFRERGHDAWSCDLLAAEDHSEHHIVGDALRVIANPPPDLRLPMWELLICHPPCTHLAVSGARWFKDKRVEQEQALDFVRSLLAARCSRIALENPVSIISSHIRKPDQIIQPWMFGHRETKATCLWLKGLPELVPTDVVGPPRTPAEKIEFAKVHRMPPGPDRWRERSRTYEGLARAMAEQWGSIT